MSEFEKKVLELLKNIDQKLDKVLGAGGSAPAPTKVPAEVISKGEGAATTAEAEKPAAPEGRRVCPTCGSTEFNQIEDKTKILHSMGGIRIYAKNYQCKKCGFVL